MLTSKTPLQKDALRGAGFLASGNPILFFKNEVRVQHLDQGTDDVHTSLTVSDELLRYVRKENFIFSSYFSFRSAWTRVW